MTSKVATTTMIPSAKRLMNSLRDIGYELPAAVADLVDNSIDAGASRVEINVEFRGEDSWIRISDNGSGMDSKSINEAMRFGSDRDYGDFELGKFGLGLKTASLSQCQVLTVASRVDPKRRRLSIRRWDLDHVNKTDEWELLHVVPKDAARWLVEPLDAGPGTVVMWERLDRLLAYQVPNGMQAEKGLAAVCRQIEVHLGAVFHRMLAETKDSPDKIEIFLQGNLIAPWDPFALEQKKTQVLDSVHLPISTPQGETSVPVQPYLLPNKEDFSSHETWERASGIAKWNRQQGFYFYRGNRLIQSGGWNRLRTLDEHTKLARIAVDIPRSADPQFGVNVSKMSVKIPDELREELKSVASIAASRAQKTYRGKGDSSGKKSGGGQGKFSPKGRGQLSGDGAVGADIPPSMVPMAAVEKALRSGLPRKPDLVKKLIKSIRRQAASGSSR